MKNEKIQTIIGGTVLIAFILFGLYFFAIDAENDMKERINLVNERYKYSRGIITDFKSYKGHSITVKYSLKNKQYEFSGGWDKNPKTLTEGDSISFRYSVTNPNFIITELEDSY